jgi:hypothetical protein
MASMFLFVYLLYLKLTSPSGKGFYLLLIIIIPCEKSATEVGLENLTGLIWMLLN